MQMLGFILVILFVIILFKVTGLVFHVIGTLLGWIFGILGWLLLAVLGVTVFGLALAAVPVILVIGVISLITAAIF